MTSVDDADIEMMNIFDGKHPYRHMWFSACIASVMLWFAFTVVMTVTGNAWFLLGGVGSLVVGFASLRMLKRCDRMEREYRDVREPHGSN